MLRRCAYLAALSVCAFVPAAATLAAEFKPVTAEVLLNPDPADWLMINRTYDEQRFSPLNQINRSNVGELRMAWTRGMPSGTQESTPMVYNGVMYVIAPGGGVQALDGTSGDLVWEYWRTYPKDMAQTIRAATLSRGKNLAMFEDMVYFAAADGFLVALDAQTGKVRWETKAHDYTNGTEHTGGLMVADGKVISNRTCTQRDGCFIAAHDAKTGQRSGSSSTPRRPTSRAATPGAIWRRKRRSASSWGLPGSYDPKRKVLYWAIANPKPYTRLKRHGSADAVANTSPSELYSNSTVALDVDTGKLVWYYQHLPGDDWDADHIHERTLRAHQGFARSEVRQVDQPDHSEGRGARHRLSAGMSGRRHRVRRFERSESRVTQLQKDVRTTRCLPSSTRGRGRRIWASASGASTSRSAGASRSSTSSGGSASATPAR